MCVIPIQGTPEEKADIFRNLKLQKRYMKAWRKYMQIMKSAVS